MVPGLRFDAFDTVETITSQEKLRLKLDTLVMAYKQRFISNNFETRQIFEKIKQHYPNFRKN